MCVIDCRSCNSATKDSKYTDPNGKKYVQSAEIHELTPFFIATAYPNTKQRNGADTFLHSYSLSKHKAEEWTLRTKRMGLLSHWQNHALEDFKNQETSGPHEFKFREKALVFPFT